jgi:hypothetical protein
MLPVLPPVLLKRKSSHQDQYHHPHEPIEELKVQGQKDHNDE